MELKEVCRMFKECNQDGTTCCNILSQYMHEKKDEAYEELSEADITGLRDYLKYYIISMYEYLGGKEEWVSKYKNCKCSKEESDEYEALLELSELLHEADEAKQIADEVYEHELKESIEPFKSHGIPSRKFNFAV